MVTIVIPAYNAQAFIERTLLSAVNQTYPNLEVIVIDDGSVDDTRAIASRLAEHHKNVRVVTVPNGGVAAARNHGTRLAKGEFVAYLDADDIWHPTKIEKQLGALVAHGNDQGWVAAYARYRIIDAHDRALQDSHHAPMRGAFFADHLLDNQVNNGSNLLVRRDAALAVGGFDSSYAAAGIGGCEDYDFQLKLLRRGKIEFVDEFLVGYRLTAGSMSANHVAMGRGLTAVVDRFCADPQVSAQRRDLARIVAHARACARFVRAGEWGLVCKSVQTMARIDLGKAASFGAGLAGRALCGLVHRGGAPRCAAAMPKFCTLDPQARLGIQ